MLTDNVCHIQPEKQVHLLIDYKISFNYGLLVILTKKLGQMSSS
jgi:hypothetical protein